MCIERMGRFSGFYFAVCSWMEMGRSVPAEGPAGVLSWRWGGLSQQRGQQVSWVLTDAVVEGAAGLHIFTLQVSCDRAVGQAAVEQMCPEALSMVSSFIIFVVSG